MLSQNSKMCYNFCLFADLKYDNEYYASVVIVN